MRDSCRGVSGRGAKVVAMENNESKSVILFDGVCNLCNGWVQFVLKRDSKNTFLCASLQSKAAQNLMRKLNLSPNDFDSIIVIDKSIYHIKSTAALNVARSLGGIWSLFYTFIIIPQSWRDKVYDFVAKNRYYYFGQLSQCMVPEPDILCRFLDYRETSLDYIRDAKDGK